MACTSERSALPPRPDELTREQRAFLDEAIDGLADQRFEARVLIGATVGGEDARMLTLRLRATLGTRATVLSGADAVQAPMLMVELDQFEQVFDSETSSSGVVSGRATLMHAGKVISQHAFVASAPANSPDAAGGVRALAAASDDFVNQVSAWLATQQLAAAP